MSLLLALLESDHSITATGIASVSAVGAVAVNGTLAATGIASAEAAGQAALNGAIAVTGVPSAATVGQPTVTVLAQTQQQQVSGRRLRKWWLQPKARPVPAAQPHRVAAVGIASGAAFGRAEVLPVLREPAAQEAVVVKPAPLILPEPDYAAGRAAFVQARRRRVKRADADLLGLAA